MSTRELSIATIAVAIIHLAPPAETEATVPKRLPKEVQAVEAMCEQAKLQGATGAAFDQLLHVSQDTSSPVRVRMHAIDRIGTLGYTEAKDTLQRLLDTATQEDIASGLRARVHLAYWRVSVAQEADPAKRQALLVALSEARIGDRIMTRTRSWAVDEICALGQPDLVPMAQAAIRKLDSTERGDEEAQVCRLKSELVERHATRLEALAAALETEDPSGANLLHQWAIGELTDVAESAAEDVLVEHARRLAQEAPRKSGTFRMVIDALRKRGWTDEEFREAAITGISSL